MPWKAVRTHVPLSVSPCTVSVGYDLGGVSTSAKREPEHKGSQSHAPQQRLAGGKEPHCLYPGDLYPFTRKPLFVVVDSDNSFVFQQIPRYFGQPLMVLMSPQDTPPGLRDLRHAGSLFTLFLHSPLAAFCLICNVASLPIHHWERCQRYVEQFLIEASRLVLRSRCGNISYLIPHSFSFHLFFILHSSFFILYAPIFRGPSSYIFPLLDIFPARGVPRDQLCR